MTVVIGVYRILNFNTAVGYSIFNFVRCDSFMWAEVDKRTTKINSSHSLYCRACISRIYFNIFHIRGC
jgi:hypothetical protein